jgi:hypothetical protein
MKLATIKVHASTLNRVMKRMGKMTLELFVLIAIIVFVAARYVTRDSKFGEIERRHARQYALTRLQEKYRR